MLSKAVIPTRLLLRSHFFRSTVLLGVANGAAGLFAYLYQFAMARLLSPEELGVLASLLAVSVIFSIFSPAFQVTAARYASQADANHVRGIWTQLIRRAFVVSLTLAVLTLLLMPLLTRMLSLDNAAIVVLLSGQFLFILMLTVNLGILQGLQRFLGFGMGNVATPLLRLVLGTALVAAGLGVFGAFGALVLATFVVWGFTLLPLRGMERSASATNVAGLSRYFGWTTIAFGAYTLLANVDVVLAKLYLSPDDAGAYAALVILGKVVLFAPLGVSLVMFPKIAQLANDAKGHSAILTTSLLYTVILSGMILIAYWQFSSHVVNVLVGSQYGALAEELVIFGFAMVTISLSYLLLHYYLALNRKRVLMPLAIGVIVHIALTAIFHEDVGQLAVVRLASGASVVLAIGGYALFTRLFSALSRKTAEAAGPSP